MSELKYITLREHPEIKLEAALWFNSKWGVPKEAYLECTRMEMNPQGDAEKVADAIIAHLEGGSGAFPVMLSPAFRRGETL